jgi:hypothetical protein
MVKCFIQRWCLAPCVVGSWNHGQTFMQRWCLAPCVVGSWNHGQMFYTKVVPSTLCGWVMSPWLNVLYKGGETIVKCFIQRWCLAPCVVGSWNHCPMFYTKVVLSTLCGVGSWNHGQMFYTKVMLPSHLVHQFAHNCTSTQKVHTSFDSASFQVVFNERIDHHHSGKDISFLPMPHYNWHVWAYV